MTWGRVARWTVGALALGSVVAAAQDVAAPPQVRTEASAVEPTDAGVDGGIDAADASGNVILIIGDGMDDQQITMARNYLVGVRGKLVIDSMPVRGAVQVLTVTDDDPGKPVFVADSANSGTAMATGVVTSRGRIATSAGKDEDLPTIVELARKAGLRTGIVATSSVADATPASFMAHINYRFCQSPAAMVQVERKGVVIGDCSQDLKKNGGLGSIAEQVAASGVDVLLGGGGEHFAPNVEGGDHSVRRAAEEAGYQVVTTGAALVAAPTDKKLLGLFSPDTMPVRLRGEGGRVGEKPERSALNYLHWALGTVDQPAPMKCEDNPEFAGVPTLKQMGEAALRHLSAPGDDTPFFLMIESASIDKQAHKRNPCGSIGELQQLDEVVRSALDFADAHPGTLVIVTSDHGSGAHIIPDRSLFATFPVPIYTPGHLVRVTTPEGATMAVNYATNDFPLEEHTGVQVPIFANELGREVIAPVIAQPDLFGIVKAHLGL